VLPVAEYEHGDDGCAVMGLGVYRGGEYPTLDGIYFSGDLCTGKVRGLQRDDNGVWQFEDLLDTQLQIAGAGQDASGTLYVTSLESQAGADVSAGAGALWRLVAADKVPDGATTAPIGDPNGGEATNVPADPATGAAAEAEVSS
jgi:hypothetical protein